MTQTSFLASAMKSMGWLRVAIDASTYEPSERVVLAMDAVATCSQPHTFTSFDCHHGGFMIG